MAGRCQEARGPGTTFWRRVREGILKTQHWVVSLRGPGKSSRLCSLLLLDCVMWVTWGSTETANCHTPGPKENPRKAFLTSSDDADAAGPRINFKQQRPRGHFPVSQGRGPKTTKEPGGICPLKPWLYFLYEKRETILPSQASVCWLKKHRSSEKCQPPRLWHCWALPQASE